MKSPPTLRHCLLLAGLALAWPNPGFAQTASNPAVEAKPQHFTLETRDGDIIEGGKAVARATVGDILEYLKKKNNSFSLALGPGVANIAIGDMILQMDSFDIHAICAAMVNCANTPMSTSEDAGGVNLLYTAQQQRQVAVFNLTSYLNPDGKSDEKAVTGKLDTLRGIILHTLADLNPHGSTDQDVSFQFHAGANLLVVTGNTQALFVTRQVVDALTQPALSTTSRDGFIPEGAAIPNPNAYNWAAESSAPSELQSALYTARMLANQSKANTELVKTMVALTELSTKFGPNHPEVRQKLATLEAIISMLSPAKSPWSNPPADNQPKR